MKELHGEVTCLTRMPSVKEAEFFVCEGLFCEQTTQGSNLSEKDTFHEGSKKIPGGLS